MALENTVHPTESQTRHTATGCGVLIINADDWGRDRETTNRIFECVSQKRVSSASGMVFMEDSARAAAIALDQSVDIGLHLNFTTPFSAPNTPVQVLEHQQRVAAYLLRRRMNQAVFHPGLIQSFEYSVTTQLEEYQRLYGIPPSRIDGHHHMHLSMNILLGKLLPAGTRVRRNFSFQSGQKGRVNRMYRQWVDRSLARRHQLTDFFFPLIPLDSSNRLKQIFSLSQNFAVEVETHPIAQNEYAFLTGEEFLRMSSTFPLANRYKLKADGN
jgi:predicted glycoside hydrolase/deacetylase ChbG (UPF0249 family)